MSKKTAYKVMCFENGQIRSGANSTLAFDLKQNEIIEMPENGIYMSTSKEYVFDYYSGLAENEVIIEFEYDSDDIIFGNDTDIENEFSVPSAKIINYEMIIDEEIIEVNPRKIEEVYANKLFTSIEGWIGSGDNGETYETSDGRVIKITKAQDEFQMAIRLCGKKCDFTANIYDVDIINNYMCICMEKVEIEPDIENLFNEIQIECKAQGCDIFDLDSDANLSGISDEAVVMLEDIQSSVREIMEEAKLIPMDIQPDNIGINSNGNYVLFDQFHRGIDPAPDIKEFLLSKTSENTPSQELRPKENLKING